MPRLIPIGHHDATHMNNGIQQPFQIFLNGHALGRYWDAGPQHDFFLPENWLKFGDSQTNNLTLNLRPVHGSATIQSAIVEPYREFAEKRPVK